MHQLFLLLIQVMKVLKKNSQWVGMNYFPKQKELVENGLYTTYNGYLIYIVSSDNDKVLNMIKN